jgi:hypothetical protein
MANGRILVQFAVLERGAHEPKEAVIQQAIPSDDQSRAKRKRKDEQNIANA